MRHAGSVDLILETVSAPRALNGYLQMLKCDGTVVLVGLAEVPPTVNGGALIGGRSEMLDFCAEHTILSEIETIRTQHINEAYKRMLGSDVKYRS